MIDAIKTRLQPMPALKLVGEAPDFQTAVENRPPVTPAVYVMVLGEKPGPVATDVMIQKVQVAVGVVFVVRNLADNKGVAARTDLEALRRVVRDELYGWCAALDLAPFERGEGHLLAFKDGHMWWQDIFITSYHDRSKL